MRNQGGVSEDLRVLHVQSNAFKDRGAIPAKYTCDGKNINPPLSIVNIPVGTKSLALIVDDPDAPVKTWVHWLVWNILPSGNISEDSIPGTEGINDFGKLHYGGPCPPSGTHRYFFRVYALDEHLQLRPGSRRNDLEKAMDTHLIGYGELVGLYQ